MSWGRIDDGMPEHKKWVALEERFGARVWIDAMALWVCALCYSNRHETDGVIARSRLVRLTPLSAEDAVTAADALVDRELMSIDADGAYVLHDFLTYNKSRAQKETARESEAVRGRDRRASSARPDRTPPGRGSDVQRPSTMASGVASSPRPPSPDPDPDPIKESVDGAAPPPGPAIEERIERLAARYPSKLLEAVHTACRLSRTTGRMSDSKWLAALESFAVYDLAIAVRAMETFADRYADGSKGERYLLGIMRGERDQPAQRGLSLAAPVVTRDDPPDWHPTHGAPKSARNFDTWEAWINDGCPRDPAWRVAS